MLYAYITTYPDRAQEIEIDTPPNPCASASLEMFHEMAAELIVHTARQENLPSWRPQGLVYEICPTRDHETISWLVRFDALRKRTVSEGIRADITRMMVYRVRWSHAWGKAHINEIPYVVMERVKREHGETDE